MVTLLRNRRGAGTLGCLVSLLIFAAVLYYGYHVGQVYWKFYQLQDAMKSQARLAPSLADDVIRRRLRREQHAPSEPAVEGQNDLPRRVLLPRHRPLRST